jgi:transposase
VFGPHRISLASLEDWAAKQLSQNDAVVIEMSTNAYELYDTLIPHVHSVTLVHPPHVALITRAQVKTDRKAAQTLAQLHAAGLLPGIWVPPVEIRERRALIAHRKRMIALSTQAKNRLHSILHRNRILPPEGEAFTDDKLDWWLGLSISEMEQFRVQSNLDTLAFAQSQLAKILEQLIDIAAQDDRVPLLIQLPGFGIVTAITILAAIGDITRFPSAKHLVGYAGLGARVHDSGLTHKTGSITKSGRRDLRGAMIQAARVAGQHDPQWRAELERLRKRMIYQKAVVAVARKLLVVVWHVLIKEEADRHADPKRVATKMMLHAYALKEQRRYGQTAPEYVHQQLDRLGIPLQSFRMNGRTVVLTTADS